MKILSKKFVIIAVILFIVMISIFVFFIKTKHISKDNIISTFNKYNTEFLCITDYLTNDKGLFYLYNSPSYFIVKNDSDDVNIDSIKINKNIKYVINKLRYVGIHETENYIEFIREAGEHEQGMVYMKNDIKPKNNNFSEIYLVKDNWYYYVKEHT